MGSEQIVRVSAPAKINLGLHVLGKRPDGYHNIETVFVAIGWCDELEFRPSDTLELICSDPRLPTDKTNLCMAAASLMAKACGVDVGATIHLEKHIPYGAGLGGGSSDAAATMRGLSRLWGVTVRDEELVAVAAQLGSDVPFFLNARPSVGEGRGEMLTALERVILPPFVTVVVPNVQVSTADAYASLRPEKRTRPPLGTMMSSGEATDWKGVLRNEFEASIFSMVPELAGIKEKLYDAGAVYASMSGSGSAVYGLFQDEQGASRAAQMGKHRSWYGRMLV